MRRLALAITAVATLFTGQLFVASAEATEITGSWTGVIEAHGVQTSTYPGVPTYETDTTVQFLGTADVSGSILGDFRWEADVAWSEVGERRGSMGGCPYVATNNDSGTSRTGRVYFRGPSEDDPEWSYGIDHNVGSPWSYQFLPPCQLLLLPPLVGPTANVGGQGPLPGPWATTLSGSSSRGGQLVSWQLTRAPDSDCDGIPDGQDSEIAEYSCPGGEGGPAAGCDGARAALKNAKRKLKTAERGLRQAKRSSNEAKVAKAKKKVKRAKKKVKKAKKAVKACS